MEVDVPFGIIISALAIIISVVISHVRQSDKIDRILTMSNENHTIHMNPEASGIGTTRTNDLIERFTASIDDFKDSNREILRDLKTSIDRTNENTTKNTIAIEKLTMTIDHIKA